MVHALYKAALFLAVGSIDLETGTRDLNRLGGLVTRMPMTALAVAGATLSMAGFPLFFGFIGKEIMYAGALAEEMFPLFATLITLTANALMTAVAAIILITPFAGTLPHALKNTCEVPWTMRIGPAFMGMLGVVFGIMPEWVSQHLIQPAVFAFHPDREEIRLFLFHGINLPLMLSIITLTSGAVIYWQKIRLRQGILAATARLWITTPGLYQSGLTLFLAFAARMTRTLQNGSLSVYLSVTVLTLAVVTGFAWLPHVPEILTLPAVEGPWIAAGLFCFILAATAVVVTARHRLSVIGGLGGVGSGVALIFLVFGAPDIALTQLLVETLTLVFVSLILLRLPPLEKLTGPGKLSRTALVRNAGLSISTGIIITTLLLGLAATPLDRSLTSFFETASVVQAHGRNIVNVILVDFRSLDTLGEICVVVLAAWAGVNLIRRPAGPEKQTGRHQ
jgi:multicomponent Na+:H+ antiporter subunit A